LRIFLECCLILGLFFGGVFVGMTCSAQASAPIEQTDFCYDTPSYEAWVATKNGFARCFFEQRSYPHRVKASHIDIGEEK